MTTPASNTLLAVRDDADLRERLIALASVMGIPNPQYFVGEYVFEIAAASVGDNGSTVASVFEYAVASYTPTPRPGQDPSKVTDTHLLHAIEQVKAAHAPPPGPESTEAG